MYNIIFLLISLIIIIFLVIGSIPIALYLIIDQEDEEEYGITAKEAYNILIEDEKYKHLKNNISSIYQGIIMENGKSDYWHFKIGHEQDGKNILYYVRVLNNGSIVFLSERNSTQTKYISEWNYDSDEIMDIVRDLKFIRDFKEEYKWKILDTWSFDGMGIYRLSNIFPSGCIYNIGYSGGGLSVYQMITIFIDVSNGHVLDVIKLVDGAEVEVEW